MRKTVKELLVCLVFGVVMGLVFAAAYISRNG